MSTDINLMSATGEELETVNLTYNLSPILAEAGMPRWFTFESMSAREFGAIVLERLDAMEADADRYRALNPSNGWGSYDSCLQMRLRAFVGQCLVAPPDATISIS